MAQKFAGRRFLVVEDEYFLADDARSALAGAGAEIVGPVGSARDARALLHDGCTIDAALLDINLRGEKAFDIADDLRTRGIPFAFVTGYDRTVLPERFADRTSLEKPVAPDDLIRAVETLLR